MFLRAFHLFFGGAGWDRWRGFSYCCRFGVGIVLGGLIADLYVSKMGRNVVTDGGVFG